MIERILVLEPLLNRYKNTLFFKSKEPNIATLRAIKIFKKKYKVKFIDFKIDNTSKKDVLKNIEKCDYLFLNIRSYNFRISTRILSFAAKRKLKIYLFGQLPEAIPGYFLKKYNAIKIIKEDLYEFAHKFVCDEKIDKTVNLDSIPEIDLEEILKRDYYTVYPLKKLKKYRFAFMNLTEGCVHKCIFCSQTLRISHGNRIIHFSPKEAVRRIKRILGSGFNAIRFADDDFLSDTEFIRQLCELLIKKGIKFRWMAQVRADKIDEKTLILMKNAGCESLNFGVESGSKRILKVLRKGESLEKIKESIKLCKKHNINVVTYFMIGCPTERLKELKKSIRFSFEIKPDILQICFFTPYEGSPFYENNKEIILNRIKSGFFHYNSKYANFSNVKTKKLRQIYRYWYLKFYLLNFPITIKMLLNIFLFHPSRVFRVGAEFTRAMMSRK